MKKRVVVFDNGNKYVINVIEKGTPKQEDVFINENSIVIDKLERDSIKGFIRAIGLEIIGWFDDSSAYGWVESKWLESLK